MRDAYDKQGMCFVKSNAAQLPKVDANKFFAIMFGSYLVEPYVGQLKIASQVENFLTVEETTNESKEKGQRDNALRQRKRVVDIAWNIRNRINNFVLGKQSEDDFRASIRLEASAISKGDFGESFLLAIGNALILGSEKGISASVESRRRDLVERCKASFVGITLLWENLAALANAAEKENTQCLESPNASPETSELMKQLERSIPKALKLVNQMNNIDIQQTLLEAVKRVLLDGAEGNTRRRRTVALRILGREFVKMAKGASRTYQRPDIQAIKRNAEKALLEAVAVDEGNSFESAFM